MARGALGSSPILAIATGLTAGRLQEREHERSVLARAEELARPKREARQRQELARTQLLTFDPTMADDAFDETRDYDNELNERRQLRRRATAYRTVNPSVSLEDAEALLMIGPNARQLGRKDKQPVQYDSTRGGYFDPNKRQFVAMPNLPGRESTTPSTPRPDAPVNWQRVTREDGTVVQVHPRTGETRPVLDANGAPLRAPRAGAGNRDAALLAALGGGAPRAAAPVREPLSDEDKARARRDSVFRAVLKEEGYTDADWAASPAAPPRR
jgi:hypothetical protein